MRIIKTNHWSEPAFRSIEKAGADFSAVVDEIAKAALGGKNSPSNEKRKVLVKGNNKTLIFSSRR